MWNKQVHLDFHTSPDIEGVGKNFSKENFQKAIKIGKLDSITVFAKCHHGLCYYPTEVGTMHPNLGFDLTGAMVEAAHEIGVRAPIYITAGWSDLDSTTHPEWITRNKEGEFVGTRLFRPDAQPDTPKESCSWQTLCLNDGGGYAEHIYQITEEVCKRYKELDGLFYDICIANDVCYCESCLKGMREMGIDPEIEEDARRYFMEKRGAFMEKCGDIMRKYHPDATIFFNSGGANRNKPYYHKYQTHYEMEDLPTAWGGYDNFPPRVKFFSQLGKHYLGMTGKFHLSWGEFGGFKTKEALKYELATMAIYGAGASVGDHMHPDGEMEIQTYENIGYAYDYYDKIAPFCLNGENASDIGVYGAGSALVDEGVSNALLQGQLDYNYILNNDFEKYKVVIIPEKVVLDDVGIKALNEYIHNGGKVLVMADALVKDGKFQIDTGLSYIGEGEYDCDYIISSGRYNDIPNAPMLCYRPGHRNKNIDAEVLAEFITPYFSRTYAHFCGHQNTPHDKNSTSYPAITKKGNVVYIAHPLTTQFGEFGSLYHRNYFLNALKEIYKDGKIEIEGLGSQGRYSMISQPDKRRYCINMVYASPVRRGKAEVIEDIMPIYNIKITLNVQEEIKNVYLGLTNEKLKFTKENGKIVFTVPELNCHTSVVVEY